ncbi:histidine kinase [Streptosporangium soli]|nr:histidine kinase [Streptosporangium sp. KLBMP 9127]
MAFSHRPLLRRVLGVILAVYLVYGPVITTVAATQRWGWGVFVPVLLLGAATVLGGLAGLAGRGPGHLLVFTLAGGLALHAIEPFTGLAFPFVVVFLAPRRLRLRWAIALSVVDVVATAGVCLAMGLDLGTALGLPAGLAYCSIVAFLVHQLSLTRTQATAAAEAQAREAVHAERSRLAREIHDILAHSQSAQIVHLEGARLLLERGEDPAGALTRVNLAVRLARAGLEETRRALDTLRGQELPLAERLDLLAVEFRSITGAACAVSVMGDLAPLSSGARLAVARTAQEALTNVRKHAPGASASVSLSQEGGWCELEVRDRGGRPVGEQATGGYGLVGMRERAELIGGSLTTGADADGFRVFLRVPT